MHTATGAGLFLFGTHAGGGCRGDQQGVGPVGLEPRLPAAAARLPALRTPRATSMQLATCNIRRATCDVKHATCNIRRATCDVQHATSAGAPERNARLTARGRLARRSRTCSRSCASRARRRRTAQCDFPLTADHANGRSQLRPIPVTADHADGRSHLQPIPLTADPTYGRSRPSSHVATCRAVMQRATCRAV
jgi:hypothetical protein